jgi:ankyrin repeat protein
MRLQGKVSSFDATPLMLAASKGYDGLVEQLCKAGADVAFTSKEQDSEMSRSGNITYFSTTRKFNNAYSVALDNEHSSTAEILKKFGAVEPED